MNYISQHVDTLDALLSIVLERMNIKLPSLDIYDETLPEQHSVYDPEEEGIIDMTSAIEKEFRSFARLSILMDLAYHSRTFHSKLPLSISGMLHHDSDSFLLHTQNIESILSRDYGITEIHPMIYSVPKSIRSSHKDTNDRGKNIVLRFIGKKGNEVFEKYSHSIYKTIITTLQYNKTPFPQEWLIKPPMDLLRPIQGVLYLLITTTTALALIFSLDGFQSALNSYKRSYLRSFLGELYDESRIKKVGVGIDEGNDEDIVACLKILREYGVETVDDIKQAVTQTISPI